MNIEQLVNETIDSAFEYVKNGVSAVSFLADEFYAMPDINTWDKLIALFEGIQWLIKSLAQIDALENLERVIINYAVWNEYVKTVVELGGLMPVLEEAMLKKDNVLIGDILLYEIQPNFETVIEKLGFLVTGMGNSDVS